MSGLFTIHQVFLPIESLISLIFNFRLKIIPFSVSETLNNFNLGSISKFNAFLG